MRDQNIQDFAQPLPNVCQVCWGAAGKRKRRLLFVAFNLITQLRPRTCNGDVARFGSRSFLETHFLWSGKGCGRDQNVRLGVSSTTEGWGQPRKYNSRRFFFAPPRPTLKKPLQRCFSGEAWKLSRSERESSR